MDSDLEAGVVAVERDAVGADVDSDYPAREREGSLEVLPPSPASFSPVSHLERPAADCVVGWTGTQGDDLADVIPEWADLSAVGAGESRGAPAAARLDEATVDAQIVAQQKMSSADRHVIEPVMHPTIHTSFYQMERRRLKRASVGQQREKRFFLHVKEAGVTVILLLTASNVFSIDRDWKWEQLTFIPILVSIVLLTMTALSTYAKPEHIMAEFARCWIYMGVLWLTWVYDPEQHPNGCVAVQFQPEFKSCLSRAETDVLWWVLVMLIGTLLIHVLVNVLYPAAVDNAFWGKGITWFWRLREVEEEPGVFTYRPEGWFSCRRMRIQYTGEVDVSTGLPDGAGAWVADTYHGEAMRGYWDQGVPVAPAFARQVGTSAVFVKLCIGIVSNRGEDLVKELRAFHWKPRARGTMQYGEAHVETSITGGYFPFLPYCERVTCFDSLNGLAPRVKVNVTRLHSLLGAPKAELREALIFVHGFNCPIAHAAERFAQLLALGRMPGHIAPFVYSWAAGRDVAYFQVRKSIPQGVGGLSEMVRGLAEQGFSTVHLLVHSLGAQVVLHEIPLLEKVVSPVGSPLKGRPSLATLTFMNADAPRERFLDLVPRMLGIAERLTGYNDHTDGALFWSELVNGKPFSKAFTFGTLVDSWHTGPDRPRYMAHKGAELEPASNDHLGLARRFDIIDCGSMDQNVYNMRHSYFCLNATLVADLTELIGRCRGADQRDRLIRVRNGGNLFSFLCVPRFVREQ
mmetsp:Transcript_11527/g.25556  ORF Transcript_11527/g.25556 Transcript_11527/m.25556 type:complete len:744 (-) Transcript_11527:479-2710(-)